MGVNSLPKTVTRQRRDCDLNPGPSAHESSTLTTRQPNRPAGSVMLRAQGRGSAETCSVYAGTDSAECQTPTLSV